MARKLLGQILLDRGVIAKKQLDDALQEQSLTGKFIGEILIEKEYATRRQIFEALTEQKKTDFVKLEDQGVLNPDIVQLLPEDIARRYAAISFKMDSGKVVVAMAEPGDIIAIDAIRRICERPIKVVEADLSEIIAFIDRYYRDDGFPDRKFRNWNL